MQNHTPKFGCYKSSWAVSQENSLTSFFSDKCTHHSADHLSSLSRSYSISCKALQVLVACVNSSMGNNDAGFGNKMGASLNAHLSTQVFPVFLPTHILFHWCPWQFQFPSEKKKWWHGLLTVMFLEKRRGRVSYKLCCFLQPRFNTLNPKHFR